jgi:hypothetical protein
MIQCKDCEFGEVDDKGNVNLRCNPFVDIKESECLLKWQLVRLDLMTRAYMATIREYKRIAPLQEKLYRRMSQEMDEMDEAERWKHADDEEPEPPEGQGFPPLDDLL